MTKLEDQLMLEGLGIKQESKVKMVKGRDWRRIGLLKMELGILVMM